MSRRVKSKPAPRPEPYERGPVVVETFRCVDAYEISNMTQAQPSCFNGIVRVHRYRVTVEVIDETKDVIAARLQKLWDESDNMHHTFPLQEAARKLGVELLGSRGHGRTTTRGEERSREHPS